MTPRRVAAVWVIGAVVFTVAMGCGAPPARLSATPKTSPIDTGSATVPAAHPPTSSASTSSVAAPPVAAGTVRGVIPGHNEGLMAITQRICGSARSWLAQAVANKIGPPDYIVLDSARLTIDCRLTRVPEGTPAPSTKPQPAASRAPAAGWVVPLPGRCDTTDEFGAPRYNPQTGQHYAHQGRDLPAPTGTPIHAITAGVIISAHDIGRGGLQIQLQAGNVTLKFNHLSGFAVHVGQHVSAGQIIGYVGMTGDATGPHLHLEIWVSGVLRNPTPFLAARGVRLSC